MDIVPSTTSDSFLKICVAHHNTRSVIAFGCEHQQHGTYTFQHFCLQNIQQDTIFPVNNEVDHDDIDYHTNLPFYPCFEISTFRFKYAYNIYMRRFLPIPQNPKLPTKIAPELTYCKGAWTDYPVEYNVPCPPYTLDDLQDLFYAALWHGWPKQPNMPAIPADCETIGTIGRLMQPYNITISSIYTLRAVAYRDDPEVLSTMFEYFGPSDEQWAEDPKKKFLLQTIITLYQWGAIRCLNMLRQHHEDIFKKFNNPFFRWRKLSLKFYNQQEIFYYKKQFMPFYKRNVTPFVNHQTNREITSEQRQRRAYVKGLPHALVFVYHPCPCPELCHLTEDFSWFNLNTKIPPFPFRFLPLV